MARRNMAPVVGVISAIAVGSAIAYAMSNKKTRDELGKQFNKMKEEGTRIYSEVRQKAKDAGIPRKIRKSRAVALELVKKGKSKTRRSSARRK